MSKEFIKKKIEEIEERRYSMVEEIKGCRYKLKVKEKLIEWLIERFGEKALLEVLNQQDDSWFFFTFSEPWHFGRKNWMDELILNVKDNLENFLLRRWRSKSDPKVLSVGCGIFDPFAFAFEFLSAEVFYLDLKSVPLYLLREEKKSRKCICGDIYSPCFRNETFDFVTDEMALNYLIKQDEAIKIIHRLLKPEGYLITTEVFSQKHIKFRKIEKIYPCGLIYQKK